MASRLEKLIGGLLGEDVTKMDEEERRRIVREGGLQALRGMLTGSGLLGGLETYGKSRQARRDEEEAQRGVQDIMQAQAAIAGRLGARGADVGEQTQLEEVRPMAGMNLQALMASPAGAAALQANPQLAEMLKQRTGYQVVGANLFNRETGQFMQQPQEARKPIREVDLGNKVRVFYSDGTSEDITKGRAPSAAGGLDGRPDLTKDERDRIYKARDAITSSGEVISGLSEARRLSDVAFEGPLAGLRAAGGAALPGQLEPAGAKETIEFDTLIRQQVLPQLKLIFGGNPTEGERKILLDLQGSSSMPRAVRNRILDRAIEAANRRMQSSQMEVEDILSGTYFTPQGMGGRPAPSAPAPAAPAAPAAPKADFEWRNGKLVPVKKG